jgi:hypothetical protein
MPAVFLTTPALHMFLLWPQSSISKFLETCLTNEVWISPFSHAILKDTFLQAGPSMASRRGLRAVERHRRAMESGSKATYPLPNQDALRIWSEVRSVNVDIPAYDDGIASYPKQTVGPDELLIFATAAGLSLPLIGPAPTDNETIQYLADLGITFASGVGAQSKSPAAIMKDLDAFLRSGRGGVEEPPPPVDQPPPADPLSPPGGGPR